MLKSFPIKIVFDYLIFQMDYRLSDDFIPRWLMKMNEAIFIIDEKALFTP